MTAEPRGLRIWACEHPACGAWRDWAKGDHWRYYRNGGPRCPVVGAHGYMVLAERVS